MALIIKLNLVGNDDETFQMAEKIHNALAGSKSYIDSEVIFNMGDYRDSFYDADNILHPEGRNAVLIVGDNNDYNQELAFACNKYSFK